MMLLLFIILTFLIVLEATTSLSRLSGYLENSPESGLILQSSLSLLSRMCMFLFMPVLGYLADKRELNSEGFTIPLYSLLMVLGLYLLIIYNRYIISIYSSLIVRVKSTGTFFKGGAIDLYKYSGSKSRVMNVKALNGFYVLVLVAYVPYYIAWPLVIFMLDNFHDQRAMLLGMSSVFNGLNTIILTVFIDPKLVRISMHSKIVNSIYLKLVKIRLYSSICSFIILLVVAWVMSFRL